MSIQTLVEKIKEKGNPTVAGLDARLEYIPQHISGRNMMLHGETLRAAAESVVAFNCGLIDALCDIVPAVKPQAAYYELLGSYGAMALKETIDYAHAKGMYVTAISSARHRRYCNRLRRGLPRQDPRRRYRDRTVRLRFGYRKRLSRHRRCRAVPQGVPQPREEPVYAGKDL